MAHGKNAERKGHCGREYWSRRPGSQSDWGKRSKRYTHRKERVLRRRLEKWLRDHSTEHEQESI